MFHSTGNISKGDADVKETQCMRCSQHEGAGSRNIAFLALFTLKLVVLAGEFHMFFRGDN